MSVEELVHVLCVVSQCIGACVYSVCACVHVLLAFVRVCVCVCAYIHVSILVCCVRLCTYVTGFGKTDHIVTIDISRNTDLKY